MEKFFAAYLTKTISLAPYLTGWLTAIAVFYAMTVIFMITLQWRLLRDEIWLRATTAYYALMMLWMSLHAFFATTLNLPILTSVLVCFTSLNLVFATHHQIFPTPKKLPLIRIALCLAGMFLNISEYLKPFHVLPQALIMGALFCQFCKGIVESYAPRERWSPIIYIIVAGIFISTTLCTVLLGLNPAFGLMATGSSLSSVWDAFLSGGALSNPLMRDKFDEIGRAHV